MEEPNKGKPYGIITQQRKYKDKRSAPFFVSDMETLLNHANKHAPYTIGILKCVPNSNICSDEIFTWYSADHIQLDSHDHLRTRILSSYVKMLESLVRRDRKCSVMYLNNLARRDKNT
jgi:hypothetical protein